MRQACRLQRASEPVCVALFAMVVTPARARSAPLQTACGQHNRACGGRSQQREERGADGALLGASAPTAEPTPRAGVKGPRTLASTVARLRM